MEFFNVVDDYSKLAPQRKFTLANSGDWFDEVDIVKELDTLNSLLVEHKLIK